ncbi:hypothetical protein [Streptomyces capparidis]
MTTPITAQSTCQSGAQGTHQFIITVQRPVASGIYTGTWASDFTPEPGWTRQDAYVAILSAFEQRHPQAADGNVVFFSLDRNEL